MTDERNGSWTPLFEHERPVSGRWEALRALVRRFYDADLPTAPGHSSDASTLAATLGTLGESVQQWLTLTEDLAAADEPLRSLLRDGRRIVVEDDRLILAIQAEGDQVWSVRREDVHQPDPPVWIDWMEYSSGTMQRSDESEGTVSSFAGRYLLGYLGGGPSVVQEMPEGWDGAMAACGALPGTFDGLRVYEGTRWIAFLRDEWGGPYLNAVFRADVDRMLLPQPLREVYDGMLALRPG